MWRLLTLSVMCSLTLCLKAAAVALPDSVKMRFSDRELTPVEGVWIWDSGALVVIERDEVGQLQLTLIDSPDPLVDTPLFLGTGRFGATPSTYSLELNVAPAAGNTSGVSMVRFEAKLSDNSHLTLTPKKNDLPLRINFRLLLPHLFPFSITRNRTSPESEGAIRVWPPLGSPEFPIVL